MQIAAIHLVGDWTPEALEVMADATLLSSPSICHDIAADLLGFCILRILASVEANRIRVRRSRFSFLILPNRLLYSGTLTT
jgi:hypothetical protein